MIDYFLTGSLCLMTIILILLILWFVYLFPITIAIVLVLFGLSVLIGFILHKFGIGNE